jgi:hypothetical protein
MQIEISRVNNSHSLESVEKFLDLNPGELIQYYEELRNDYQFLKDLSDSITINRNFKSEVPGLFERVPINNVDWFGFQRILLYCLVRKLKPEIVVETGVYYGGNSSFILAGLAKNDFGKLIAIDYPQSKMENLSLKSRHPWVGDSEIYSERYTPGFMIPQNLLYRLELIISDSLSALPTINEKIDFFIHDSEHTLKHVLAEMELVWQKLSNKGILLVDDIDWSNGFFNFVVDHQLYPLLLTDNGKDNLRVRTGLILKEHRYNSSAYINM